MTSEVWLSWRLWDLIRASEDPGPRGHTTTSLPRICWLRGRPSTAATFRRVWQGLGEGVECRHRDRQRGYRMLTRRHLIALSTALTFAPGLLVAEPRSETPKADYPHKPVRLIVTVATGGPTNIVARMLSERLSAKWGQQVVVENKGGAGTNIGNEYVAQSDPDGYTLLFATASLAVNTSLYRSLSYDPIADLAPVRS